MYRFIRLSKTGLLLMLALLLITAASCADKNSGTGESKVNWLTDWNEALSQAQAENKPIMIDFYTDYCPACDELDSNTFTDDELGDFLNNNFVCLKSNAGESGLYGDYGVSVVPTIVFTSPVGTEFGRMTGYRSPDQFYQDTQEKLNQWEP